MLPTKIRFFTNERKMCLLLLDQWFDAVIRFQMANRVAGKHSIFNLLFGFRFVIFILREITEIDFKFVSDTVERWMDNG